MSKDNYELLVKGDDQKGGDIIDFFEEITEGKNFAFDLKFVFV